MNLRNEAIGAENEIRIYDFIVKYILDHAYPPTVREICAGVSLGSTASVNRHLRRMMKAGVLESDSPDGSSRAIRVPGYKIVKE